MSSETASKIASDIVQLRKERTKFIRKNSQEYNRSKTKCDHPEYLAITEALRACYALDGTLGHRDEVRSAGRQVQERKDSLKVIKNVERDLQTRRDEIQTKLDEMQKELVEIQHNLDLTVADEGKISELAKPKKVKQATTRVENDRKFNETRKDEVEDEIIEGSNEKKQLEKSLGELQEQLERAKRELDIAKEEHANLLGRFEEIFGYEYVH